VVTTEGVSCITTQTNSKGVFLCFNVEKQMRDYEGGQPAHDTRVYTRATREYMHARLAKHKSRAYARVAHKESRAYTKNEFLRYFCAFSDFGVFWKVLANWNTFPTVQKWGQTELQNSRYGSSKIGVFSVTFMKCRHATKSWKSGHRQRRRQKCIP
jgi:hypothetical protein